VFENGFIYKLNAIQKGGKGEDLTHSDNIMPETLKDGSSLSWCQPFADGERLV
jgi:hypothetical protein